MLHQIGAGALGPVFRAYQPEPGRLVAVKLFRLDLAPERAHKLVSEFERLIAADLSHPGIAAPIATGLYDVSPYLAQDFVTADSLDVVVRAGGSSSPTEVARVARQLAAALDFAAERGVLHGALHPRDVMLSTDDVRVTGLGVARALEQVGISTPVRRPYSSPERAVGGPWDGRADMFSLAALMFELLFGRRVSGSGERAVVSLPEVPGVSRAALKKVFAKALSGDPGGRFLSGSAFADALEDAFARKDSADASASRQAPRLPLSTPDPAELEVVAVPVEPLGITDAVDIDLNEQHVHDVVAAREADAQASESHLLETPKRGRRKAAPERVHASVPQAISEAADVAPALENAPPHIADPSEVEDVEEAAQGIERWLANEREARPGGAEDLLAEDVASGSVEPDALDLHVAPPRTLFDEHPLDRYTASLPVGQDVAALHGEIALPVDHDLAVNREEVGFDRSAAGLASAALETTRTAVWPMVLSFVVGGAVFFGAGVLIYLGFFSADVGRGVSVASAPSTVAPVRIEEPALVTEPPPSQVPAPVVARPEPPSPAQGEPPAVPATAPVAPVVDPQASKAQAPKRVVAAAPVKPAAARVAPRSGPMRTAAAPGGAPAARRGPAAAVSPVSLVGGLRIESRPAGATVLVDGRMAGRTPLSLTGLSAGAHPVAIEAPGFRRWATSVKIIGGQQVRVGASLEQ